MLIFVPTYLLMGTKFMNKELTIINNDRVKRKRRTYSDDFKHELLIQKCHHPYISIARVALEHGINTNLLNRWVKLHLLTTISQT